jgi:hypothetical protein
MRIPWSEIVLMGIASALVAMTGCSNVSESQVTYAPNGAYSAVLDAPTDKVVTAANKAAKELNFAAINGIATIGSGQITAQTADGREVHVWVERVGHHVCRVTVQVGDAGDEHISEKIVDHIRSDVKDVT